MSVCVIPARGGSKRIPRKNIRPFLGAPMIGWSIRAALATEIFDRVVVSTDDTGIAEVAEGEGAEVPFLRAEDLSGDLTPTVPVIADAVTRLDLAPDVPVCCLYATAPFVTPDALAEGHAMLARTGATYVFSVTTFPFPIQRALRRADNGAVEMLHPSTMMTRSQDLEECWHDAGQFYWALAATWRGQKGIFAPGAHGLPVPRHRVQDIDTEEDWARAEYMMQAIRAAGDA